MQFLKLLVIALVACKASGPAATPTSGGLDSLSYFLGTWHCHVHDSPNALATADTDADYTFKRGDNRIAIDIKPFPAVATRSWTFDAQTQTFAFEAHVGHGAALVTMAGSSPGWNRDQLVWTGTIQEATRARQTFIKHGVAEFELVAEIGDGTAWRTTTRSQCTSRPPTAARPAPSLNPHGTTPNTRHYDYAAVEATDGERARADVVAKAAQARVDAYVESVQNGRADKDAAGDVLAAIRRDETDELIEIFGRDRTAMLREADREQLAEGPPDG